MQPSQSEPRKPRPTGLEAWLPPLAVAVASIAVVVALIWFVVIARPLQGRIAVPRWTIPAATTVAIVLAAYLFLRAILSVRAAVRGWRMRRVPPRDG